MLSVTRAFPQVSALGKGLLRPQSLNGSLLRLSNASQLRQMSFFSDMLEKLKSSSGRDKELNEKLAKLQKEAQNLEENESLKKAKETMGKVASETEKIKEASDELSKKLKEVFQNAAESDLAKKTREELEKMAKEGKNFTENMSEKGKKFSEKVEEKVDETTSKTPYLKKFTSGLRDAKEELVDSTKRSSRLYGGFRDADERRIERSRREKLYHELQKKQEQQHPTEADPNAGSGMVLHKDSAWKESWSNFKDNNPFMQRIFSLKRDYDESDNPLVHYLHRFQDSLTGIFAETEHAQVLKEIKMVDPTFNIEEFTKEMHDYIIPEVLEAYLHGNKTSLRQWCSEAAYSVLMTTIEEREKAGYHVDSRILELKAVDLAMAKMIDERPVLIFTFNTQQITVIRDRVGKIVEGKEDDVESVHYVMAMVKDSELNPITSDWKVMEIGIQATIKTW